MLETHGLTKHFGGVRALTGVSLSVRPGEVYALIGPNGAGKTTVLNLLTGLLKPSQGRIRYRDTDITNAAPHEIARLGISRTFQNGRLFRRLTVLENVMVGSHARLPTGFRDVLLGTRRARAEEQAVRERSLQLLSDLNLAERAHQLVTALPFGQQRMVEFARALISQPDVLLLDEPAAGLNSAEVAELQALLQRLQQQGLMIVLIEHNMGLVMRLVSRIAVLNFGEKIAEGTPEEIRNNDAVLDAYLGHGYRNAAL